VNTEDIRGLWKAVRAELRRGLFLPARLSRWTWAADAALALAVAIGALGGALHRVDDSADMLTPPTMPTTPAGLPTAPSAPIGILLHHYPAAAPWQLALALVATLPLAARRRYPLAAFGVVITASTLYHLSPGFDPAFTFAACVIAAYSAAVYSPHQPAAALAALAGAVVLLGTHEQAVPTTTSGPVTLLVLLPLGLAANTVSVWTGRMRAAEDEKAAAAQRAVAEERSRIAQELHDVVTHSLSVMMVQAGAARMVLATAPSQAHDALLAVEAGGRAAMTELRHTMDLLTMTSEDPELLTEADLAPAPGLDQLEALAARVRETGLPVELTVTGTPVQPSPGLQLAVYRTVQEALTNAMKHAVGARVTVLLDYGADRLRVTVSDTGGSAAPTAGGGNGRGLIGIQERAAVYGGTFEAGKLPTGGYRVTAVFPLETP
jgi:signal transduction histidine kinase